MYVVRNWESRLPFQHPVGTSKAGHNAVAPALCITKGVCNNTACLVQASSFSEAGFLLFSCRSLYVPVRFLSVGGMARDGAYRHPPWMRRRCVLRARPVRQRVSPVPDTSVCVFPLPGACSQSGVNYHIQVFPPLSEMIPL